MTQYYEYELIAMKRNIERIMIDYEASVKNPDHQHYESRSASYSDYLDVKTCTYHRLAKLRDACLDAELFIFEDNMDLKKIYDEDDIMNHLTDSDAIEQLADFYYKRHDIETVGNNDIDETYNRFLVEMYNIPNSNFHYLDANGKSLVSESSDEELDPETFGNKINLDD